MDDDPDDAADTSSGHEAVNTTPPDVLDVVAIAPHGDVVLDVLFETSKETLRSARQAERSERSGAKTSANRAPLQQRIRMAFRADAAVLKKHSRYFANLLGDTRFQEARAVEEALAALHLSGVQPADADTSKLPWVRIVDDDEGSRSAGRELVFAELLRILHGADAPNSEEIVLSTPAPAKSKGGVAQGSTKGSAKGASSRSKESTLNTPAKTRNNVAQGSTKGAPGTITKGASSSQNHASMKGANGRSKEGASSTPGTAKNRSNVVQGSAKSAKTAAAPVKIVTPPAAKTPPPPSLPGFRWSAKTPPSLCELATLALQADRFDCAAPVAAYVRSLRLRFPQPVARATRDEGGRSSPPVLANEEAIRQKIFVAWIFDMPAHFDRSTRDLILYGSQHWLSDYDDDEEYDEDEEEEDPSQLAAWWDLPDGLEGELQFRRACIMSCIASVPRHFLALYTSRQGPGSQCKMGYGSSGACDSFQLGEMVKFLCHKDLLCLRVFGPSITAATPVPMRAQRPRLDGAAVDVYHILAALRQCPAYQLDRDHVNCGLRTRMLPILEYIQAMLAASAVAIRRRDWGAGTRSRDGSGGSASWLADAEAAAQKSTANGGRHAWDNSPIVDPQDRDYQTASGPLFTNGLPVSGGVFRFTRAVAGDQRLRLEGNMAADRMARALFTAQRWDWTPED